MFHKRKNNGISSANDYENNKENKKDNKEEFNLFRKYNFIFDFS